MVALNIRAGGSLFSDIFEWMSDQVSAGLACCW